MIVKEEISGKLIVKDGKVAIRLASPESGEVVYLAYALTTQGPGDLILPAVLIDDWGNEIGGMKLYDWIKVNGLRFPRAEVFGVTPSGDQAQYFLRDLEPFAKFPVYAFPLVNADDSVGMLVQDVFVPDEAVMTREACVPPAGISPMLAQGQLAWWRVNPNSEEPETPA